MRVLAGSSSTSMARVPLKSYLRTTSTFTMLLLEYVRIFPNGTT